MPLQTIKKLGEGTFISPINIENSKARELVNNIDKFKDLCLSPSEEERISKWRIEIENCSASMVILRKKEGTCTEDEIRHYKIIVSI